MRNNLKEASQPLELQVLELKINRLTLQLNQNKIPIRTQMRIDILFEKAENLDLIIVSEEKNRIGEEESIFFIVYWTCLFILTTFSYDHILSY